MISRDCAPGTCCGTLLIAGGAVHQMYAKYSTAYSCPSGDIIDGEENFMTVAGPLISAAPEVAPVDDVWTGVVTTDVYSDPSCAGATQGHQSCHKMNECFPVHGSTIFGKYEYISLPAGNMFVMATFADSACTERNTASPMAMVSRLCAPGTCCPTMLIAGGGVHPMYVEYKTAAECPADDPTDGENVVVAASPYLAASKQAAPSDVWTGYVTSDLYSDASCSGAELGHQSCHKMNECFTIRAGSIYGKYEYIGSPTEAIFMMATFADSACTQRNTASPMAMISRDCAPGTCCGTLLIAGGAVHQMYAKYSTAYSCPSGDLIDGEEFDTLISFSLVNGLNTPAQYGSLFAMVGLVGLATFSGVAFAFAYIKQRTGYTVVETSTPDFHSTL